MALQSTYRPGLAKRIMFSGKISGTPPTFVLTTNKPQLTCRPPHTHTHTHQN
jgi:hypothetical protein